MASTAEEFAERVFTSALGAIETFSIHIGDALGMYRAFNGRPMTAAEMAAATGVNERYATEWLEQQTAYGLVDVDLTREPIAFTLPTHHAEVLTDNVSGAYLTPLARMLATAGSRMDRLLSAYRSGGGVSWDEFGQDMRESQADMNRPFFTNDLAGVVRGMGEIHDRLSRPGARVADVGCGAGWSTLALARAYPNALFFGYDIDSPSIRMATEHALQEGLDDRVSFHAVPVGQAPGDFDVAFAFEAIHDMSQPVPVLAEMRRMVGADGVVVVMDEAVGEAFDGSADDVERLMYGFSLLVCLPDGMSAQPSVGTGTVMRPSTLERYAGEAGFSGFALGPEAGFFRFYELSP